MTDIDPKIKAFLDNIALQNSESSTTIKSYLTDFDVFVNSQMQMTVTDLIAKLKSGTATSDPKEEQPYRVLAMYSKFLQPKFLNGEIGARTFRLKVGWARTLLEVNFIPISSAAFKQQVKMPKPEDPETSPVDKNILSKIMIGSDDITLSTYEMWLGSMGWRATESLTIQNQHFEGLNMKTLKFEDSPSFINVSGKNAKTKKGKRRRLTGEMKAQLEQYLAHKYRPRVIKRRGGNGKWTSTTFAPTPEPTDYVFLTLNQRKVVMSKKFAKNAYKKMSERFRDMMDRMGVGMEESGKRHKITLHTFRRFCFTTCTRIVDEQYAKYHIGRRVHEYDKRTPEQINEDFELVEAALTFLDVSKIETINKELRGKLVGEEKMMETMKDLQRQFNELKNGGGVDTNRQAPTT